MGGRLLTSPSKPVPTYKEIFTKNFPYYLTFGMSAEEYWDGDAELAIAYRKKHEIEKEESNWKLWLQGLYIYDALVSAAPTFRSLGTAAPHPYPEKPYALTPAKLEEEKKAKEEATKEAQKATMLAWRDRVNAKMRARDEQGEH